MIKENMIITIDTGARYLLLHELENIEGKDYFYAIGVTDDDDLDYKDILFFERTIEDGKDMVEKVDPESETYKALLTIECMNTKLEDDPSFGDKLEEFVRNIDNAQSSN